MSNVRVIYTVNAEFEQTLEDIEVSQIDASVLSVGEGGFHENGVTIKELRYDCPVCDREVTADMWKVTRLAPKNVRQCVYCDCVVCDDCMRKDMDNRNICYECWVEEGKP